MRKHFRKFVAQNVIDESFKDCNTSGDTHANTLPSLYLSHCLSFSLY